MAQVTMRVWRGTRAAEILQRTASSRTKVKSSLTSSIAFKRPRRADLACRWNCKAGKMRIMLS